MKYLKTIRAVLAILSSLACILLVIPIYFQNRLIDKIIFSPFLICSIAIWGENIFEFLNKEKIVNIFKYINRIYFWSYILVIYIYFIYYAIVNEMYLLILVIGQFLLFVVLLELLGKSKKK